MGGFLQALLGGNGGGENPSPTDSLIKMILGAGAGDNAAAPAAPDEEGMPAEDPSASAGPQGPLADVLPPAVAAKVAANPGMYPNLAAILGQKQTKVNPLKPLDYLIAAAHPIVSGLANMMAGRRSDRKMNFLTALGGGALGSVENIASHPERMKAAQHERDIQNILLQHTLRGKPEPGINTDTGKPEYRFNTGENMGNFGPVPHPTPVHPKETRTRKDAQGNEIQEEFDQTKQTWVPSMREETTTDASGKTTTQRVPFVSPKQAEKPMRELRVGSDIAGAKKGTEDDQYYWLEQGKQPVASGLYRSMSDRPTREGDINRAEKHQVNQWAVKALADAHARAKPDAKPEEIVNDATETFRKAAGTSKALASKSSEVSSAIRDIGKNVRSQDEFAAILAAALSKSKESDQNKQ